MNALSHIPPSIKRLVPLSVKRGVRSVLRMSTQPPRLKHWTIKPESLPWFDQPNALEVLEKRKRKGQLNDADYCRLHDWVTNGYFVVPSLIGQELIDGMMRDLDALWTAERPYEGLNIDGLRAGPDGAPTVISHREVLAMTPEARAAARDRSNWRIHGFPEYSRSAKAIHENPELIRLTSLILGQPARPAYSINFMYGSTQSEHQDTAVFHIFPPNYIVGVWIACEDISPDSGPLMFYPGSHREPLYNGFTNYPQTNLRTVSPERMREYHAYAAQLACRYDRHLFLAKKGDALLWHGMVLHGGSEIKNPSLTRRSFAIHCVAPRRDVSDQVVGPFNW